MLPHRPTISRRQLLAAGLGLGLGGSVLHAVRRTTPGESAERRHHLVWVWQFADDGEPDVIGRDLLDSQLGIVLKTHDGTRWMSEFDDSPYSVSGPDQVAILAAYYESAGVPFHAWAVVEGLDPLVEAEMAASVLAAGARSLYLDLGAAYGSWKGTPAAAGVYGRALRRLQPDGRVLLTLDPRPWLLEKVPWREFAEFSDALAIQEYWRIFSSPENRATFAEAGFAVPPGGPSPDFLVHLSHELFGAAGKPMTHVGDATAAPAEFARFIHTAMEDQDSFVGVWRYGTMSPDVASVLREEPPPPASIAAPAASRRHVVVAGETLSELAELCGVSIASLVAANGLASPDELRIGQELTIP